MDRLLSGKRALLCANPSHHLRQGDRPLGDEWMTVLKHEVAGLAERGAACVLDLVDGLWCWRACFGRTDRGRDLRSEALATFLTLQGHLLGRHLHPFA